MEIIVERDNGLSGWVIIIERENRENEEIFLPDFVVRRLVETGFLATLIEKHTPILESKVR